MARTLPVMDLPSLDDLARSLGSYAGRDKALRTIYFLIQLHAQKSPKGKEWMVLAKQMSSARMVLRQFNGPSQYKALLHLGPLAKAVDKYDLACTGTVTVAYSFYWVVELVAWLSDAKILPYDAARLFRYCLYLWLAAIVAGIARQVREVYRKGIEKGRSDLTTLVGLLCDGLTAVHMLPHKILWAGKLTPRQSSTLSLVASLIGWSKTF